jgi:carboxypeptidase C (cathepsin A)
MFAVLYFILQVNADTIGPWNILGFTGYSGEIITNGTTGSSTFFWQFNAVNGNIFTDRRPLIIWSEGGPGCSSQLGMLGDRIAPFYIDSNLTPQPSDSTWALNFHLLSIDFPYNSGYSYSSLPSDLRNDTASAVQYLYGFLQILGGKFPAWFNRDVYWFGSEYAGHFIPSIATLILNGNSNPNNVFIRLKGIGLGDPWSDASFQSQRYADYGYNLGLFSSSQRTVVSSYQTQVYANISSSNNLAAFTALDNIYSYIKNVTGGVDVHNIRQYSYQPTGNFSEWLNLASTKATLNVPPGVSWQDCNWDVRDQFAADVVSGLASTLMPNLLNSIKVLIYHGQDNMYVNNLGLNDWLNGLSWPYISNFKESRKGVWNVQAQIAGYAKVYTSLTYVQLNQAGNRAPYDQPIPVRDMVSRFIFNQGWN